ncbi:MAG: PAS domain-containing protein [Candidatus Kryptoniota bacterium]
MNTLTYLLTFSAAILVTVALLLFLIYQNLRQKVLTFLRVSEQDIMRFNRALLGTLPQVLEAENLKDGYEKIIKGLKSAFDCDAIILERRGDSIAIISYDVADQGKVSDLLIKAGVLSNNGLIPLSESRRKLFAYDYIEFEDPFELLSDMTTSAASRKIKKEMGFARIAAAKAGAAGSHSLLILARQAEQINKERLTAFAALIGSHLVLSSIRNEFEEFRTKFEDELEAAKRAFRVEEAFHQFIFEKMPIPAVLLDKKGFVIELNQSFEHVFGNDFKGNSLFGLPAEKYKDKFAAWLVALDSPPEAFEFEFREKSFRALKVAGFKRQSLVEDAVFFIDITRENSIERELESMLGAATSELESTRKILEEERAFSESLLKDSAVPLIGIREGVIEIVSDRASEILSIPDGRQVADFVQANGFSEFDTSKEHFETRDKKNRFYKVRCWNAGSYRLAAFNDVTEEIRLLEELKESDGNFKSIFEHSMPAAIAKGGEFEKWNQGFYELFKETLSAENSLSSFYRFLGESPEEIDYGLEPGRPVRRLCKSIDGRTIELGIVKRGNGTFVLARDLTEVEMLKQNLRVSASRISALLESMYDEPVIIVENEKVINTNYAAREKLGIYQDAEVDVNAVLNPMRVSGEEDLYYISDKFYKLESSKVQNIFIYRLRNATGEVKNKELLKTHRDRETLMTRLVLSENYTQVLSCLKDLSANIFETYRERSLPKVVGIGLGEISKGFAEVYLYSSYTGKIDPPLSLTLTDDDKSFITRSGKVSRSDVPDTTFGNVLSISEAGGIFNSSASDGTAGFAFASFTGLVSGELVSDLNGIFGAAASVALGLFTKANESLHSVQTGKLLHAISGLSSMASLPSEQLMKFSFEFLKSEYGCNGVAYYELEDSGYRLTADTGGFLKSLSIDLLKFGIYFSGLQSVPLCEGGAGDLFFAVQSHSKNSLLLVQLGKQIPAPFELTAVSEAIIELTEFKRLSERESAINADLNRRKNYFEDYINRLTLLTSDRDVLSILEETLYKMYGDSTVEVIPGEVNYRNSDSLYISKENVEGKKVIYTVDMTAIKGYVLKVSTIDGEYTSSVINLAADRIGSLAAVEMSRLQMDINNLRRDAELARSETLKLRASVEKVPFAIKHARIEIDRALAGLSSIRPDNEALRASKLHLAAALKEISLDMVESGYSLEELVSEVRKKLSDDTVSGRIRRFNLAAGADFKMDAVTFDILKDIFVSSVKSLPQRELDILVESFILPGKVSVDSGEPIEKTRRKLQINIKSIQLDETSNDISENRDAEQRDFIPTEGTSIRMMATRLERLGYDVEITGNDSQLQLSITENIGKAVKEQISKSGSALLVEDDRSLSEEESLVLLEKFEQLRVVHDAIEAEKLLRGEMFSYAFVDLSLPSISGRELCLQIKTHQPQCFTVLLTNREDEEKSDGIDEIVVRPLDTLRIEQLLQNHA